MGVHYDVRPELGNSNLDFLAEHRSRYFRPMCIRMKFLEFLSVGTFGNWKGIVLDLYWARTTMGE